MRWEEQRGIAGHHHQPHSLFLTGVSTQGRIMGASTSNKHFYRNHMFSLTHSGDTGSLLPLVGSGRNQFCSTLKIRKQYSHSDSSGKSSNCPDFLKSKTEMRFIPFFLPCWVYGIGSAHIRLLVASQGARPWPASHTISTHPI